MCKPRPLYEGARLKNTKYSGGRSAKSVHFLRKMSEKDNYFSKGS